MARVNSTGKETASNFSPANGTGLAVRTAIKDVFESLRTINSASGDPSGTANLAAFQPHIDSDTNLLKIRNSANSAFVTLGNVSQTNFGLLPLTGGTLTGVLQFPNGTASAPSIHFNEQSTGFFRKSSHVIGISTSGTERMNISSQGLKIFAQKGVKFYDNDDSHHSEIKAGTLTANRTITLPNSSGTLALTDDIAGSIGGSDLTGLFSLIPAANNTHDLGTSTLRWRNLFTNDLNLSNEGGANDVDGTWGSYTIQEGQESLFLINKRNGKKYKFLLEEVT
tara:strand:+ start:8081 stop:8923 length:843 start_codon:yes stop_codon:yes gene_type:complete